MNERHNLQSSQHALERLQEAEHSLEKALEKGREAERAIEDAGAEVKAAIREEELVRDFAIEILYDGVKKNLQVRAQETVKMVLDKAIHAFGPLPNPHLLSLYKDGKELSDSLTVTEAGIKPHDVLLLRPSTVKGGR
jgi:hypothetical protein